MHPGHDGCNSRAQKNKEKSKKDVLKNSNRRRKNEADKDASARMSHVAAYSASRCRIVQLFETRIK
jgi:hypothetical protein